MTADLETVAFRMVMNSGQADEYRRRHDGIWPELAAELRARGVVDYRIFLDPETGHLFAVMTRRKNHALESLPQTDVMQRWWAMMVDIMQTNPDGSPTQISLAEMFVLQGHSPQ